jgi:hypothetical protein
MANAVVTKSGDIVEVVSGDLSTPFTKIAQNVVTGFWVGLNSEKSCVDSNLELVNKIAYNLDTFESIDAVTIDSADKMYNELKALL